MDEEPRDRGDCLPTPQTVLSACHDIIDCVAVILTNGEFIAPGATGEAAQAVAEIRQGAEKIAVLVRGLQAACRRPADVTRREPESRG
jgi:hypothetical protein